MARGSFDAAVAEALAFRWGLTVAFQLQFRFLEAESDCVSVVVACREARDVSFLDGTLQDSRSLGASFSFLWFCHVFRAFSELGHVIAKRYCLKYDLGILTLSQLLF